MSITLLSNSGKQAGAISSSAGIGVALASDQVVVTAVGDSGGNLKLVTWKVSWDGKSITRIGDSGNQAGTVSLLDMAGAANNRFVTAVRAANSNLLLIAWQVNTGTGAVTRLSDSGSSEGAISLVTMAGSPLGDGRVLIAVRDGGGNLVVKNWEVTSNGALKRVGDTALQGQPAGEITLVAIGGGGNSKIVTAVRDGGGNLKLIVWEVLANGGIKRLGDSGQQGEGVSLIDIAGGEGYLEGYLVTAIRDSGGNLKLISWKISPDGKTITKIADSGQVAGGIDRLSSVSLPKTGSLFEADPSRAVTAVRTKDGSLKLIVWKVASNGAVTRIEDFDEQTGAISLVRISPTITKVYLVAVRDSGGNLKLITWRFDQVQPEPLPANIVLYEKSMWENTAKVVAPDNVVYPKGKIIVNVGSPRWTAGLVHRDLLGDSGTVVTTAPTIKVAYPLDPTLQTNATDNQIIRLQDHSLMAIKNGYTWSDLSPQPTWFDTVDINFEGAPGSQTSQRARNAVYVFRSTDNGQSWSLWSVIDAAVVEQGNYGWPQGDGMGNYGVGGFDRTEIYQDPWTKAIYISGHGDGGPYQKDDDTTVDNNAGIIFASYDNGKTWSTLYKKFGSGAPYVMTSTPDYPLVVFRLTGKGPWLHFLAKGSGALNDGQSVVAEVQGKPINAATDDKTNDLRGSPPCIARIGGAGNRVWIAYPTLNSSKRQAYLVCTVTFGGAGKPTVEPIATIEAEDSANASCVLGAFVQDDLVDSNGANKDNFTLFYWIEAPPKDSSEKDKLLARYKVFFGAKGQFKAGYLSVSNDQRRYFARSPSGDYYQGGFFYWDDKVNFLTQWRETDGIKGNIVSIAL